MQSLHRDNEHLFAAADFEFVADLDLACRLDGGAIPFDVAGVYGAAGAGLAVGGGARAIVLANQKGAVLELSGRQVGLMANADLSGLAITMR